MPRRVGLLWAPRRRCASRDRGAFPAQGLADEASCSANARTSSSLARRVAEISSLRFPRGCLWPEPLNNCRLAVRRPFGSPSRVFGSLSRAVGVVPALEAIKADLAHPTSDRIIEVMIVAHERGGPIVLSILRDLTDATTKDMWAGEELATLALEQKINARVVFVIPWVVLAFITTVPDRSETSTPRRREHWSSGSAGPQVSSVCGSLQSSGGNPMSLGSSGGCQRDRTGDSPSCGHVDCS